jgi:hypothetical protein
MMSRQLRHEQKSFMCAGMDEEGDFWCVTCYFNPKHYKNRYENYYKFWEGLRKQRVKLLTIELAASENDFDLRPMDATVMVRRCCTSVMWHKERLLNIAIKQLPDSCTKVCWLDCDIIFGRADWAEVTSKALDSHPVVQPFSSAIFLGVLETPTDHGQFRPTPSFARYYVHNHRYSSLVGSRMLLGPHHPGYAWAAQREVLEQINGLYDCCVLGHADLVMAAAFTHNEQRDGPMPTEWEPYWDPGWSYELKDHIRAYQKRVARIVKGDINYVGGNIYHLWHGSKKNRNYHDRGQLLREFNPKVHIKAVDEESLYDWTSAGRRAGFPQMAGKYFTARKEDST